MNKFNFKTLLPHIIAVIVLISAAVIYLSPTLSGKVIRQSDIIQSRGMSQELRDFREKTGEEALWTNSMFGGMPTFQIYTQYPANFLEKVEKYKTVFPPGTGLIITLFIGFYILLLAFKVDPWLSLIGALAFGLSTYFIFSLEAGHTGKLRVLGYVAPTIAGIVLTYRGKWLAGAALTALSIGLAVSGNHLQITYYLLLLILIIVAVYFIHSILKKEVPVFIKRSLILLAAGIIGVGPTFSELWATYVYGKETIRGGSSELSSKKQNSSGGLDKDYAMRWSYGITETLTLMIADFYGGGSTRELSEKSNTYQELKAKNVPANQAKAFIKNVPTYWGDQPFTSGPVYFGAIVCFLFVLSLFIIRGPTLWWVGAATVFSIALAWGRHAPLITDFFFNYFPLFNKFRTPSMILIIAAVTMPLLGILGLNKILRGEADILKKREAIKTSPLIASIAITGGICLLFALIGGSLFNFSSNADAQMQGNEWLVDAIRTDRAAMLRQSAFKSLILILAAGGLIWVYAANKLKKGSFLLVLGLLIVGDLWIEDKKYLNKDHFVKKKELKPAPTPADQAIMKDQSPNYRVLNLTVNTFNDATTSYYHKSVGGYHAAKLIRYQDLIENRISTEINQLAGTLNTQQARAFTNTPVLNMLNTKYVIAAKQANGVIPNPYALGNAWFVANIRWVENADAEIGALTDFNPSKTAIADNRYKDYTNGLNISYDSAASIKLTSYEPNHLVYGSKVNKGEQFAVFSEVYYEGSGNDWQAYIDGQPVDHIRVNYTLRGLRVPEGQHKIEFKYEPVSYYAGEKISLGFSILLTLLVLSALFFWIKRK